MTRTDLLRIATSLWQEQDFSFLKRLALPVSKKAKYHDGNSDCGDVHYKAIEVHLGATLDGKLEHSGALGGADAQRAGLKLAASNT